MSPLPSHGKRINLLSDLVKIILRRQGKDWECFDPITLKIPGEAGLEPDTCFYIDNSRKTVITGFWTTISKLHPLQNIAEKPTVVR